MVGERESLHSTAWANRLQGQGFTVVPLPVSYNPTHGTAANVDLFIVSNDIASGDFVAAAPRLSDRRPIITYEWGLHDDLGMSATGTRPSGTSIDIEDPTHPLAAGFSGRIQIYDFPQGITELGDPIASDVEVIASNFGTPVIAVLERGEPDLNGNPSPGQRIAVFAFDGGDPDSYTNDGWTLLDLSVFYALASGVVPGDFNGDGALDVTDVDSLVGEIIAGTNNPDFDVTGDGNVDDSDLSRWLADAAQSLKNALRTTRGPSGEGGPGRAFERRTSASAASAAC